MATVTKLQLKCNLTDGKSAVINLPAPINMTLTDEDSGETLHDKAFPKIKAAYASDDGKTVTDITFSIVKTTTTVIAENYNA